MSDISQARVRKARFGRDAAEAAAKEKVPFKNGDFLAIFFALLYAAAALGLKNWLAFDNVFGSVFLGGQRHFLYDATVIFASILAGRYSLKLTSPGLMKRNSRLLMLFCVCAAELLIASAMLFVLSRPFVEKHFGITPAQIAVWAPYLLPALLAPALATLLSDAGGGRAVCIGIGISHAIFVPIDMALPVFLMCLIPSFIKHRHIAKVRRRSQLLAAFAQAIPPQFIGALMPLAYYFGSAKVGNINEGAALGVCMALTVFSVAVSFVATIILLPMFEHIFATCSNIKLNNYADLEHPLLRILSNDAPGTYQHAMKVADLAFGAAEKIGANPLLCRVGAYFHDIGKIDNPRYFGENLGFNEQNPHDKLPPSMSASILEAHIKQGLAHAYANTFPPELRRIIKEHHGTTVKDFFLFKARNQAKLKALETGSEPERVDESSFRYDSDKPTVKETGILLLADSVEAAARGETRSLDNITPQFISNLVEDVTKKKINDGQFDECPLSFTEINAIKKSFIVTLQHILHNRIAYPKEMPKDSPASKDSAAAVNAPDNSKPSTKPAN